MENKMKQSRVVALIPLREGSKEIPLKNIKQIGGKPLCWWVLNAAISSNQFDSVFVSTESKLIASVVESFKLGVEIIDRPKDLAEDGSTTESVMFHFLDNVEFETLVTIQATSPLLRSSDLASALVEFNKGEYDSMLSVVELKKFVWSKNSVPLNYLPQKRPFRNDVHPVYVENGAFYITRRKTLQDEKCRLGGRIGLFAMANNSLIELDSIEDWEEIEKRLFVDSI